MALIGVNPGDRIELVFMPNDPDPIAPGTQGTVTDIKEFNFGEWEVQISVDWDNGRTLMLVVPPDEFVLL